MSPSDRRPRDPFRPADEATDPIPLARPAAPDSPGTLAGDIPLPPARRYPRLRRPRTYSITLLLFAAVGVAATARWVADKAGPRLRATPVLDIDTLLPPRVPTYAEVAADEDSVLVSVSLTPRDARLFVDGQAAPSNPVRLRRGQRVVTLLAWAPGYATETRDIVPDRDLSLELNLRRERRHGDHDASTRP